MMLESSAADANGQFRDSDLTCCTGHQHLTRKQDDKLTIPAQTLSSPLTVPALRDRPRGFLRDACVYLRLCEAGGWWLR